MCTHAGGSTTDMDEHIRVKLDGCFTGLFDSYSTTLQKLLRTPIPLSYTRHTSRACLMWCAYIPLTLYAEMGFIGSAISSAFITFLFLGIDDIGVNVEDPCRLLPLDEICAMIQGDVLSLRDNANAISMLTAPDSSTSPVTKHHHQSR